MTQWTVFGAQGFIGRSVADTLRLHGEDVLTPTRAEIKAGINVTDLGHVVYSIGMTADFRRRLPETVQAHVCVLHSILNQHQCKSITYLSSTRVYAGSSSTKEEDSLCVNPTVPSDVYNISKLAGESLCLHAGIPAHVIRLSNVFGSEGNLNYHSPLFINAVLRECATQKKVLFHTDRTSQKDYIYIDDAVASILGIVKLGETGIFNVAFGANISNGDIAAVLEKLGVAVEFSATAEHSSFIPIVTDKLNRVYKPQRSLLDQLPMLLDAYRTCQVSMNRETI